MSITGFEAYHLFLALKNHFYTKGYDYFKYHGKLSANEHSYMVRNDRLIFQKAAKRYSREELIDLIVSNLLVGRKTIIAMIRDESDEAEQVRKEYVKRRESFTYMFAEDLDRLLRVVNEPKDLFRIREGSYPEIINQYLNRNVPIETLAALDKFIDFSKAFDQKLGENDFLWETIRLIIKKYKPFLEYDEEKIRQIVRNKFLNRE